MRVILLPTPSQIRKRAKRIRKKHTREHTTNIPNNFTRRYPRNFSRSELMVDASGMGREVKAIEDALRADLEYFARDPDL